MFARSLVLLCGLVTGVADATAAETAIHERVLRVLPNDQLTREHMVIPPDTFPSSLVSAVLRR